MTLGENGNWLAARTGDGGTTTLALSFFWIQLMAPWTKVKGKKKEQEEKKKKKLPHKRVRILII